MEYPNINEIWKQNEAVLDQTRTLNTTLLREVKLNALKSSLTKLLFFPTAILVFFTLTASYALYFVVKHPPTWYFVFSASIVIFFSLFYISSSIKQLNQLLSFDYQAPVVELQTKVTQLKTTFIRNLKIAAWVLPFGPFIGVFTLEAILNVDVIALSNNSILVSFGISTVLLQVVSLIILNALKPKNLNKKWTNWMLKGNGSQLDEAFQFLDELKSFETK